MQENFLPRQRRYAVAIDDGMPGGSIGGVDRDAPGRDGKEHEEGQERGSQGGHLGFGFLNFLHEHGYESVSLRNNQRDREGIGCMRTSGALLCAGTAESQPRKGGVPHQIVDVIFMPRCCIPEGCGRLG